jgi:hypothetical protein
MGVINVKIIDKTCKHCKGSGCLFCNNTGRYIENYSYYIDEKKKIAFDGEPGK